VNRFDRIVYSFLALTLTASCAVQCTAGSAPTAEPVAEADQCLSDGGE